MFEGSCEGVHILRREQRSKIRGLWWITPKQRDPGGCLEETRNLVTGHQNRNRPGRARHPLDEFALGVRVRPIDLIEAKTEGRCVSPKEGCDAPRVCTRLGKRFNIRETSKGLRSVEFQRLKSTRSRGREHESCLSDSRGAVQEKNRRIGAGLEVRLKAILHIGMADHLVETLGTPGFTPHT